MFRTFFSQRKINFDSAKFISKNLMYVSKFVDFEKKSVCPKTKRKYKLKLIMNFFKLKLTKLLRELVSSNKILHFVLAFLVMFQHFIKDIVHGVFSTQKRSRLTTITVPLSKRERNILLYQEISLKVTMFSRPAT